MPTGGNFGNIYDVLNGVRVAAGYADRIPEINQNNLHNLSFEPPEVLSDFVGVLGKIARQYIFDTVYSRDENPFAEFFMEELEAGMSVEDLYVDLIEGATPAWDDDGSVALSRKKPNVAAIYHKQNYEMQYKVSTSYAQSKNAFMTRSGVESLTNRILGTLNSSCEYDLFLECLELLSTMIHNGVFVNEYKVDLSNEAGIKSFLKKLKTTVKNMTLMGNKYNSLGILTKTARDNIIIIMKPSDVETVNVDYLAGAFNMSVAEIKERIIEVPDDGGFGTLDDGDTVALVMDKRAIRIWPTLFEGSSIYNPASLVTNTFLTDQFIFSYGTFFNAVRFTRETAPTRTVLIGDDANGKATANPQQGVAGTAITITAAKATKLWWEGTNGREEEIDLESKTFTMPDMDVTIHGTFSA